jgi:hypothetical protein
MITTSVPTIAVIAELVNILSIRSLVMMVFTAMDQIPVMREPVCIPAIPALLLNTVTKATTPVRLSAQAEAVKGAVIVVPTSVGWLVLVLRDKVTVIVMLNVPAV